MVTSHSADLLDNDTIPESAILAVLSEHAETRIGPLDEAGRSALRDHLFTAGELLRMDQLRPTRSGQLRASSICSSAPTGTNNRTTSNGSLPMRDTTHATHDWRAPVRTGYRFGFGSVSMVDSVMYSPIRETTAPWLPVLRSPLAVPDEDLP